MDWDWAITIFSDQDPSFVQGDQIFLVDDHLRKIQW